METLKETLAISYIALFLLNIYLLFFVPWETKTCDVLDKAWNIETYKADCKTLIKFGWRIETVYQLNYYDWKQISSKKREPFFGNCPQ